MRARRERKESLVKEQKEEKDTILLKYQNLMVRYPTGMNLLQGVLLACLGSAAGTQISQGKTDWNDILIMSIVNATFITPVLMMWFRQLDKVSRKPKISHLPFNLFIILFRKYVCVLDVLQ